MTFSNYPGSTVGRAALALIRADGNTANAIKIAQRQSPTWGESPLAFLKAGIAPGRTTDSNWAGPLVPEGAASFVELVGRENLLGRIAGFVQAPASAPLVEVAANGNAYWTGESFPKPVTAASLSKLGSLAPCKVTSLVVVTNELERASGLAGEQLITRALSSACGAAIERVALIQNRRATAAERFQRERLVGGIALAQAGTGKQSAQGVFGRELAAHSRRHLADQQSLIHQQRLPGDITEGFHRGAQRLRANVKHVDADGAASSHTGC